MSVLPNPAPQLPVLRARDDLRRSRIDRLELNVFIIDAEVTAAMWHPERVSRLAVLNCPHPSRMSQAMKTARQLRRSWYIILFQLPWLPEALLSAGNYAGFRWIFRRDPSRHGAYSEEDIDAIVAAAAEPGALTAMIDWYRAFLRGGGLRRCG